ncbi:MAG TPA: methyltransferase domain-containing protein [Nocardioidaceae bacterium]|nr:methyltransferase domain-containing protein [Nocardioidaceae bacterium]
MTITEDAAGRDGRTRSDDDGVEPVRRPPAEVLDAAYAGEPCLVVREDGVVRALPVEHWQDDADEDDHALFVRPCSGDVLDVGCGPGRLMRALAHVGRGRSLGIDTSHEAVRQAYARGVNVRRRNVFHALPAQWDHVMLADGNIGIGGDPERLLRRCAQLVRVGGRVLVEVGPEGGVEQHRLHLRLDGCRSESFAWASVGIDGIDALAEGAGLRTERIASSAGRRVATLVRAG